MHSNPSEAKIHSDDKEMVVEGSLSSSPKSATGPHRESN